MILSLLAYSGLGALLVGVLALLRPGLLRLRSRRPGVALVALGLLLIPVGAWWPVGTHTSAQGTVLDAFVPHYQFREFHATRVRATPRETFRAIRAVTAGEIPLFRVLTWIRSPRLPGRGGRETILNPHWEKPILGVALRSGFIVLGEEPGKELVVGTVVCCKPVRLDAAEAFRALDGPGYARAAMNFRVEELGDGTSRLTTETRVVAAGPAVRRRFGLYWSLIYPGSSLIRRGWLGAIRRRAERS